MDDIVNIAWGALMNGSFYIFSLTCSMGKKWIITAIFRKKIQFNVFPFFLENRRTLNKKFFFLFFISIPIRNRNSIIDSFPSLIMRQ